MPSYQVRVWKPHSFTGGTHCTRFGSWYKWCTWYRWGEKLLSASSPAWQFGVVPVLAGISPPKPLPRQVHGHRGSQVTGMLAFDLSLLKEICSQIPRWTEYMGTDPLYLHCYVQEDMGFRHGNTELSNIWKVLWYFWYCNYTFRIEKQHFFQE